MAKNLNELRVALKRFRNARETAKELGDETKKQQPILINMMEEAGVSNEVGIVWDEDDPNKGTAYIQQNKGTEVWDEEAILDYLSKRKALRMKATSRILDIAKWETLVASREVSPAVAKRMQKTTPPPAPFIRFGKNKDNSL